MEKEVNSVVCRKCYKKRFRISDGKYDAKNKRWVDEKGQHWNGRKCPKCHAKKQKQDLAARRARKKEVTSTLKEMDSPEKSFDTLSAFDKYYEELINAALKEENSDKS
jgi:formate-dependent nitrite reductase cytochrome c552 subunit